MTKPHPPKPAADQPPPAAPAHGGRNSVPHTGCGFSENLGRPISFPPGLRAYTAADIRDLCRQAFHAGFLAAAAVREFGHDLDPDDDEVARYLDHALGEFYEETL